MVWEAFSSLLSIPDHVFSFLADNGWYVLIALVISVILYNKFFKSWIDSYRAHRAVTEYDAKYDKKSDGYATLIRGQQDWANRMQEKYNKEMEAHRQKLKEREEKKKQEQLEKDKASGHVLGRGGPDDKPSSLRSDYNPLMGAGSSSNYRPPKRSACGGGGCGR